LKTKVSSSYAPPHFDAGIAEWVAAYEPDEDDWGGPTLRVGIMDRRDGVFTVYRAIDGDGRMEIDAAYKHLESIGMVDFAIYNHPRFNCIYGFPDAKPGSVDTYQVAVWS
jgi:hypothetical protein